MIRISFQNSGGEMDHLLAATPGEAAEALIRMMYEVSELHPGDTIVVTEVEGSAS
jgi:hypothetical protein